LSTRRVGFGVNRQPSWGTGQSDRHGRRLPMRARTFRQGLLVEADRSSGQVPPGPVLVSDTRVERVSASSGAARRRAGGLARLRRHLRAVASGALALWPDRVLRVARGLEARLE